MANAYKILCASRVWVRLAADWEKGCLRTSFILILKVGWERNVGMERRAFTESIIALMPVAMCTHTCSTCLSSFFFRFVLLFYLSWTYRVKKYTREMSVHAQPASLPAIVHLARLCYKNMLMKIDYRFLSVNLRTKRRRLAVFWFKWVSNQLFGLFFKTSLE